MQEQRWRTTLALAWEQAPRWAKITILGSVALYYSITLPLAVVWWFYHAPLNSPLDCLARNVYWEAAAAKQPHEGLRLVAWVTLARATDNRPHWGGSRVCEVVYKNHQHKRAGKMHQTAEFSWTLVPAAKRDPANWWHWARAVWVARWMLWRPQAPTGYEEARYYLNPKTADRHGACWFYQAGLVELGAVGDHTFYREPRAGEKRPPLPEHCRTKH